MSFTQKKIIQDGKMNVHKVLIRTGYGTSINEYLRLMSYCVNSKEVPNIEVQISKYQAPYSLRHSNIEISPINNLKLREAWVEGERGSEKGGRMLVKSSEHNVYQFFALL